MKQMKDIQNVQTNKQKYQRNASIAKKVKCHLHSWDDQRDCCENKIKDTLSKPAWHVRDKVEWKYKILNNRIKTFSSADKNTKKKSFAGLPAGFRHVSAEQTSKQSCFFNY